MKPELLVTPHSVQEIPALIEAGADAFILGEKRFALRLAGDFPLDELKKALEVIKGAGKKAYVAINAVLANEMLEDLRAYLQTLKDLPVDGLRFSDPGALMLAREEGIQIPLHWSSETMGTNFFTANYWLDRGASRVVLAPEIMKDAVLETAAQAKGEIEVLVHGAVCMFHSRRLLLGNYMTFQGMSYEKVHDNGMFSLYDPERQLYYPIFEDQQGTHIFNGSDVCMIDDLADLVDGGISSIRIDGAIKDPEYLRFVIAGYRLALDLCQEDRKKYLAASRALFKKMEEVQPENRKLDRGFFYKPSIYKNESKK